MGQRQPGMHRHEAGLDGEADEQAQRGDGADRGVDIADFVGNDGELEAAGLRVQQQDAEVHHVGTRGAHQEVDEAGAQGFRCLFMDDQEVRGPGHEFPEDVEVAELVGAGEAEHRAGHEEDEEVVAVGVLTVAHVAPGIEHDQKCDAGDHDREEMRGGIQAGIGDGQHKRGQSQQHGVQVAHHARVEADDVERKAADVGDEHQQRPGGLELRHPRDVEYAGQCCRFVQEGFGPQAHDDGERRQQRDRESGSGRRVVQRPLGQRCFEADALDHAQIVEGGDDARQRTDGGQQPLTLFDRGVQDDELAERTLEWRQAHHREHGEAE